SDQFEIQPMTERIRCEPGKVRLRAQVKKLLGDWPKEISGLLIQNSGNDRQLYELKAPISQANSGVVATIESNPETAANSLSQSLWTMLLYAFLGGLILNIMPCVLPVIALKILGFVGQAKDRP